MSSGLSQVLHPAMISITTAVEYYRGDTFAKGSLGYCGPHQGCQLFLVLAVCLHLDIRIDIGGRCQSVAVNIIDNLSIDMVKATEDTQARPLLGA